VIERPGAPDPPPSAARGKHNSCNVAIMNRHPAAIPGIAIFSIYISAIYDRAIVSD
jgi:H2-forming N5,N10-methylenetetrahydromethanopterin dehydrogenase-like enzyme